VSVFLVSSTMFILEHIWAFGGDTESGFCFGRYQFPLYFKKREREKILGPPELFFN
jgi:hypothetical protein